MVLSLHGHLYPLIPTVLQHNEIILDLNVQYSGDLRIEMAVEVADMRKFLLLAKTSIMNMAFAGTRAADIRSRYIFLLFSLPKKHNIFYFYICFLSLLWALVKSVYETSVIVRTTCF